LRPVARTAWGLEGRGRAVRGATTIRALIDDRPRRLARGDPCGLRWYANRGLVNAVLL